LTDTEIARLQIDPGAAHDLGLTNLVRVFSTDAEHQKEAHQVLVTLCQDPDVIRYRQDVFDDLLRYPQLAGRLEALLPVIDALIRFRYKPMDEMNTMHEVTWRMGELQGIVDCVRGLGEVFKDIGSDLVSQGLRVLRDEVTRMHADPTFNDLAKELPALMDRLRTCASVTIGVNLDAFLRPVEATLLAVNDTRFTTQSLLKKMFGQKVADYEGIAQLHSVPKRKVSGPYAFVADPSMVGYEVEPLMVPLFKDLAMVVERITLPIARELKRFTEIESYFFVNIQQDLCFYLGALNFIRRMRGHGLPMCRPEIASIEDRVCQVEGAYNANLALYMSDGDPDVDLSSAVVQNDIRMDDSGRVLVLTGPNQGGKTTYIQGCGLLQVLAQAGLFIPGVKARISPVDNIYTHFPLEEKPEAETGRFGDEARRLGDIFQQVTRYSMVFLNETLSSTSAGESLYLAQDIIRILRRIGARAIYSTHLHDLAAQADELNDSTPGDSKIASLVSSPIVDEASARKGGRRSYRIEARPPMGRSYAHEIAARYGISYDQLEKMLAERGVLR